MTKNLSLSLLPSQAADEQNIKTAIAAECSVSPKKISGYSIQKRSIDARGRQVRIILQIQVFIDESVPESLPFDPQLQDVSNAPHIVIASAGPAGLFAALRLIKLGY